MCGIGGFSGAFEGDRLLAMVEAMAHRGPDDQGVVHLPARQLGLAHARLAIQDLTRAGHQPMWDPASDAAIVFNGEIYNFIELRKDLEGQGVTFSSRSDTEVLLQLYLNLGTEMLLHLDGIFSFAIWDSRNNSMFLARDAFGVKPLYYLQDSRGFAFASEIKALLALVRYAPEIDARSLQRYVSFLWCPGEGTPYRSVKKLPPGEALTVREGGIAQRWRWHRSALFDVPAREPARGEAIPAVRESLRRAVHAQMVSDAPVGAFLSGGLDSSAVVAMARERVPDIRCFTINARDGSESGFVDDLRYAKRVAEHLDVSLEVVTVDASSMAADLENMVFQLDEPLADPACLNLRYISALAGRAGIKVLLSGAGGDDVFTGYRRHAMMASEPYWCWVPRRIRRTVAALSRKPDQRMGRWRRFAKMLAIASHDGDERLAAYYTWTTDDRLRKLFDPDFLGEAGVSSPFQPMLEYLRDLPVGASRLRRALALEQRFFLADHNLTYTDKMAMAEGVEVRVPFLDPSLVSLAASLPDSLKQRGRHGKWVLKKAMEPYLPRDVIYRPKKGFGAPLRRWLRNELRDLVGDVLSPGSLRRRGIFRPRAVQELIRKNSTGEIDASYTILSLVCIELWMRRFVDEPTKPSVVER